MAILKVGLATVTRARRYRYKMYVKQINLWHLQHRRHCWNWKGPHEQFYNLLFCYTWSLSVVVYTNNMELCNLTTGAIVYSCGCASEKRSKTVKVKSKKPFPKSEGFSECVKKKLNLLRALQEIDDLRKFSTSCKVLILFKLDPTGLDFHIEAGF